MRRLAAILLVGLFLALGSGGLEYAHNLAHLHSHANADAERHTPAPSDDHHDATNCFLHAMLRAPILAAGWTAVLVCLGLFVAFLTLLAAQPVPQRFFSRLDCRGPPASLLIPA